MRNLPMVSRNRHQRRLSRGHLWVALQSLRGRLRSDLLDHSLAWPGAHPLLSRGTGFFDPSTHTDVAGFGIAEQPTFDPTGFSVRLIPPAGKDDLLESLFVRWHYAAAPGMRRPAFGLYWHGSGRSELVGIVTFARICNPRWAELTFRPTPLDLEFVAMGRMSPIALSHRLVAESEYLELNRLALVDPAATHAPLARGAASWFVARCLHYFEERNRALWLAQHAYENGLPLTPRQRRLLEEARLGEPSRGRGFIKTIVSFADPWEGHVGYIYQALGLHYAGRTTDDGRWEPGFPGLRSGQRISKRTIQKAKNPRERGHDSAVLRLIWEGGEGEIRVYRGTRLVHTDDARWLRATVPEGRSFDFTGIWSAYRQRMADRYGDVRLETHYFGGGVGRRLFPPKHRYMCFLGAAYWRHELERRCIHLRERMLALDAEWMRRGWGPRPDTRAVHYPKSLDAKEVRPDLAAIW